MLSLTELELNGREHKSKLVIHWQGNLKPLNYAYGLTPSRYCCAYCLFCATFIVQSRVAIQIPVSQSLAESGKSCRFATKYDSSHHDYLCAVCSPVYFTHSPQSVAGPPAGCTPPTRQLVKSKTPPNMQQNVIY